MTTLREAAQQALEQLKINRTNFRKGPSKSICKMLAGGNDEAIADLESALAEPVQEPFGYLWPTGRHPEFRFTQQKRDGVDGTPLYTAPHQRTAEPTLTQQMTDAGFTPRDNRLTCDECGGKFTRQMLPIHKCAALAKPMQEPVAWVECDGDLVWNNREAAIGRNLYTSPPPQQTEPSQDTPPQHEYEVTANDDGTFSVGLPDGEELRIIPPQRPAEPVQEPFGYLWPTGRHPEFRFTQQMRDGVAGMPLYTAPPQRKPLTEEEIDGLMQSIGLRCADDGNERMSNHAEWERGQRRRIARAIERWLKGNP